MIKLLTSTVLFCALTNGLLAQKNTFDLTYQKVTLTNTDSIVEATLIRSIKKTPTAKDHLEYHWYRTNKIHHTQGGFQGQLLYGTYMVMYTSGQLKRSGSFKKGLKHGQWKEWSINGVIKQLTTWKNGVKHGQFKKYDENGNVTLQGKCKNGQLSGKVMVYNDSSKVLEKQVWSNGNVKAPKVEKEKAPKKDIENKRSKLNAEKSKKKISIWPFKKKERKEGKKRKKTKAKNPKQNNRNKSTQNSKKSNTK